MGEQALALTPLQGAEEASSGCRLPVFLFPQGLVLVVEHRRRFLCREPLHDSRCQRSVNIPGGDFHFPVVARLELPGRGYLQGDEIALGRRLYIEAAGGESYGGEKGLRFHGATLCARHLSCLLEGAKIVRSGNSGGSGNFYLSH